AVAVLDVAGEHVGDRFHAPMRMPGEALCVVRGRIRSKIVEQKKRIVFLRLAHTDRPMQVNAGALDGGLALDDLPHSSRFHHGFHRLALDAERPRGCIARWERLFVSLFDAILRHVRSIAHSPCASCPTRTQFSFVNLATSARTASVARRYLAS